MDNARPYRSQVRERGQLTIPKKIREKGALYDGESVTIIPVGDAILVSPQKLGLEEARREIRKLMKRSGVTVMTEDKIGTMLPCNVIVQELAPGRVEVAAIDPLASMAAVKNEDLGAIGLEVREKLKAVVAGL
jgi:bifunctional DNA-binding transcriptional regulator/antitoxin component of YhaV-PrlF toxin-antitoxin module